MVKAGYKQTEFGVIPDDWGDYFLGEVSHIIDGDRGTNYPSSKDLFSSGFCLFLSAKNVSNEGFRFSECIFITTEKDELLRNGKLDKYDIVLTTRGTVGNVAFFDNSVPFDHIRINSGMVILREKKDCYYPLIYIILKSSFFKKQIERSSFGSAQPQLTVKGISQYLIPLPKTKKEQKAIAEALSDVDALIASLEKLIAKKRAIKTATMQQLLTGKTRLPGFSGEWGKTILGQICSFENGDRSSNYPSPSSFRKSGIPFINAGHVADGKISPREMDYITQEAYDRLGGGKVMAGDILFCLRGSLGKFGLVSNTFGKGAIASSLVIIRPKNAEVCCEYLLCYFSSALCAQMIEAWAGGAAQPNLGAKELARFSIWQPSLSEQTAIATVLSDMDSEITSLEQRRNKTKAIKQGMMQELLTGRTRLL